MKLLPRSTPVTSYELFSRSGQGLQAGVALLARALAPAADCCRLAEGLDDVMDHLDEACELIQLYELRELPADLMNGDQDPLSVLEVKGIVES